MEKSDEKQENKIKVGTHYINGPTSFEALSTLTYNVIPDDGVTYMWTVTGGTLISGQGTDTVTITWAGTTGIVQASVVSDIVVLDTNVAGGPHRDSEE